MALKPGRDVDQQREAGGVGFGEAVFAEALDLLEAAFGEVLLVAALDHAVDEFLAEILDLAAAPEGGHGPAQAVGLAGREAGADHGDAHGLFLEERHAQRLP